MSNKTKFLNVDLEIRADEGLDDLLEALEPHAFVMDYDGGKWASLELNDEPQTAAEAIRRFHDAVQSLQAPHREIWEALESRCFNIGILAGGGPPQAFFRLPAETLGLVSAMKAEVTFTVYGANEDLE